MKKYNIAIFVDPSEAKPPSNMAALEYFLEACNELGINADIVTINTINNINSYDGIFLRATTSPENGRYCLSILAEHLGLMVIDSSSSILACCDKIYQSALFKSKKINHPKFAIINKWNLLHHKMEYPLILKDPDSSFSRGVVKIKDPTELMIEANKMFLNRDELLLQEFIPTEFDWRIGIIDNKMIYACKYYMAKNHWQIYNWKAGQDTDCFEGETVPVSEVPQNVLKLAKKSAKLIGNGLYGVDIKVYNGKPYVIEVNDNPSIDHGLEDRLLGKEIYLSIIKVFKKRLKKLDKEKKIVYNA